MENQRKALAILLGIFSVIVIALLIGIFARSRFAPIPTPAPTATITVILPSPTPTQPSPSQTPAPPTLTSTPSGPQEFYVSPTGTAQGDGSKSKPWDLQTALNQPAAVHPGDTIWLLNGQYNGSFISHLKGAPNKPVIVRQAVGQRATLIGQGPILTVVDSQWTYFWGFEITQPNTVRTRTESPNPETGILTHSVALSNNIKFINLILHDMPGTGLSWWRTNSDSELYGSLLYYNGSTTLDHGIYTQNQIGTKKIEDNFIFDNASHGIHVYGSATAYLDNYVIMGNTVFNNGTIGFNPSSQTVGTLERNILVGGNSIAHNPVVISNYTYYSGDGGVAFTLGYLGGSENADVEDNYFMNGKVILSGANSGLKMIGNTLLNRAIDGISRFFSPQNSWLGRNPVTTRIFVQPNQYEPGRANLTIYNWGRLPEVTIPASDLASVDMKPGDHYELHNVEDYFNDIITGTYDGNGITIPMTGRTIAQPIGVNFKPPTTFPEFGGFVLITLK